MIKSERRNLLKSFFALPFIAPLGKIGILDFATGAKGSEGDTEYDQRYRAVRILRFVNTVQSRFLTERGSYAGVDEFKSSEVVTRFLESGKGDPAGFGTSLYGQLRFGEDEIVPGWRISLNPSADRLRYVALVSPLVSTKFPAFATDERGLIHEGKALDVSTIALASRSEQLIGSAEQIRTEHSPDPPSRLAFFLSALGGQLPPGCFGCTTCGSKYPCCCQSCCGRCNDSYLGTGYCCLNCGCSGCAWCINALQ